MNCFKCHGHGLPSMSHRDGGICYQCGALPAHRADTATEPAPLTYWQARERFGAVIDELTALWKGPDSQGAFLAGHAVELVRAGHMEDINAMWGWVRRAREAVGHRRLVPAASFG